MNKSKPTQKSIAFFGTPEFALKALYTLVEYQFNIACVVTAADKPAGRGKKLRPSPVKLYALKHNIPLLQPTNLKSPGFIKELTSYNPVINVIVAFRMLPKVIWSFPKYGSINLHASLLPNYRGAAPINWVIINGEQQTGVTIFRLKHEIDHGDIIAQEIEDILPSDNVGTLYEKLAKKGAELLAKSTKSVLEETASYTKQVNIPEIKSAHKIFKSDCKVNLSYKSKSIINKIRGLSPYPGGFITIKYKEKHIFCKLLEVKLVSKSKAQNKTCPYFVENHDALYIQLNDLEAIEIKKLQLEGKKILNISEFLKGNSLMDAEIINT